jgi:hypothetical protein
VVWGAKKPSFHTSSSFKRQILYLIPYLTTQFLYFSRSRQRLFAAPRAPGAPVAIVASAALGRAEARRRDLTYFTWTAENLLRHKVFVGSREDKPADQVRA